MKRAAAALFLLILTASMPCLAQTETRLLRFPTVHGDQIVFSYAGDLYTVTSGGGVARKMTSHPGYEMFPRFSPDGKAIAFTGQYDGNTEVYLMPSAGGVPRRLTFTATLGRDDVADRMGPNNIVMAWKHGKPEIAFRTRMRSFNSFNGSLFLVSAEGGLPEQIPVPRGGFCSFSPDDGKMAYNRIFREFRTWKKYRGGMADDVWIFDFTTGKIENITSNPAQDIIPMWSGNRVYFLSDRGGAKRMNLFVHDLDSRETRQLTRYTDFDIKFPSIGPKAVVYEYGGAIHRFDLATDKAEKVSITIADDRLTAREGLVNVAKKVSGVDISPDGKRALFGARGEIFTVPAKHGPTRVLAATSGIHERDAAWSPDGKRIAFISDASREDEIYIVAQDGSDTAVRVTRGAETYKFRIVWSPDSKKLLWSDRRMRLRYVDVETKAIHEAGKATRWEIRQYAWSPDSKWIAYARQEEDTHSRIYLFSLETGKTHAVTEGWYASSGPAFSSDGKFLLFVSSRDFKPIYSRTEWNHAYQDMARIYLVALSRDVESPLRPRSDEVEIEAKEEKGKDKDEKKDKKKEKKKAVEVKVDLEGLQDRIVALPVEVSSYGRVAAVGERVYYIRKGAGDKKSLLLLYDLEKRKETTLGQFNAFVVSADHKKMLVTKKDTYAIIDLPKAKIEVKDKLDLSGLEVRLDRRAEWSQIFNECWRQMREFFYAPGMHGVDWKAMRERYGPLVAHVNHRNDLTYIIGEMIGELNVGHAYVGGGDRPEVKRIQTGLLGAEVERDSASGYYRIKKILRGQNWDKALRSPLTEMGVGAGEGDYVLEVNGRSTSAMTNIYEALVNTAGKQVKLRIGSEPKTAGSRVVTVVPIADEAKLYYYNWVEGNIEKVSEATGGRVGYLHVPDMGRDGLNEFVKHFYPQLRKEALIVDVRGNGGGNVSPMIIERLRRKAVFFDLARNTAPGTDPKQVFLGPLVCLMDEFSASDGDIFPYRFKHHKLGTLIGKRSWGGVVGIRGSLPLVDGGILYKPEYANYDLEGKSWPIEGYGVDPDIVMDNDPAKEFAGIDEQLRKGIEVALEALKTRGRKIAPPPAFPEKK